MTEGLTTETVVTDENGEQSSQTVKEVPAACAESIRGVIAQMTSKFAIVDSLARVAMSSIPLPSRLEIKNGRLYGPGAPPPPKKSEDATKAPDLPNAITGDKVAVTIDPESSCYVAPSGIDLWQSEPFEDEAICNGLRCVRIGLRVRHMHNTSVLFKLAPNEAKPAQCTSVVDSATWVNYGAMGKPDEEKHEGSPFGLIHYIGTVAEAYAPLVMEGYKDALAEQELAYNYGFRDEAKNVMKRGFAFGVIKETYSIKIKSHGGREQQRSLYKVSDPTADDKCNMNIVTNSLGSLTQWVRNTWRKTRPNIESPTGNIPELVRHLETNKKVYEAIERQFQNEMMREITEELGPVSPQVTRTLQ